MLATDRRAFLAGLAALGVGARAGVAAEPATHHGLSMYGELRYGPDFTHFDYADPNAPKGGTLVQEGIGSFDSFNPFILRGTPAASVSLVYETLTERSLDEPFSQYGLLAKTITVPEDRSSVTFEIDPAARWHDGHPVTADDVVFTFETLTTKGHPQYRYYYASVAKVEALGERRVTFQFDGKGMNRELPLIVGQLSVLPKHWWLERDFEANTLEPPLGSGPYRITSFDAGRGVTLQRVRDHWARDLPVNRGRHNFDEVRVEYYRDRDVSLEAFKAGRYDLRAENSAKRWATGYTGPAIERGLIKVEKLPIRPPARMQGYIFNERRPIFGEPAVRRALAHAFDFEWSNKTLFYGQYQRIESYFHGEPSLMATGLPEGAELALLEPHRPALPPELFTTVWAAPRTDGSGNIRDNLREALRLARTAGWAVKDGVLTHADGRRMEFEILLSSADQERIAGPFVQNLERLGARARLRTVDPSQYQNRLDAFDFDVTVEIWGQSSSPGNEQREYWGSEAARTQGSRNTIGIASPVVDALIENVIRADTRAELEAACRALDRVLLWGFHVVTHFTDDATRMAWWDKFGRPAALPSEGLDIFAWWIEAGRASTTVAEQEKARQEAAEPQ